MKLVATFNVPYYGVDSYQAKQAVAQLKGIAGVESVRLYEATEGDPRYALELEFADEAAETATSRTRMMTAQYAAYISDLKIRTFRQLA